ncbi:hypothetical protein ACNSOO_04575 [Aliarcobacter lanthieri]|uniref:hypothetical protein n=1 Tax=Aliarcobacter lanthieri TaxID=1355374 RepID=UPI003AAD3D41
MKDKYYPIMDKPYTELITEAIIDETVPVIKTVAKTLYNRHIGDVINNYREYRFTQIQNRFIQEEELLSPEQVKNFYKDIDDAKLDLLFDLLNKARTTAYDLHAKILSKLYGNFLRNSKLNYHEKTLLSNIDILNDEDLIHFHKVLKNSKIDILEAKIKEIKILYTIKTYTEYYIFEKLERVGLFIEYKNSRSFQFASENEKVLENKSFYIHNFTVDIYNVLDLILENNHSS